MAVMASSSNERYRREPRYVKRRIHSYSKPLSTPLRTLTFQEWPEHEKEALLEGLKTYGHHDLDSLAEVVPGKSKENIKLVISTWWKSARMAMLASANGKMKCDASKPGRKSSRPPDTKYMTSSDKVPIDQWLLKLENSQVTGGSTQINLLAKVFLYISRYEYQPPPEDCNGIDFKALYEFLYCKLSGYPGKDLNPETSVYLLHSLREMAVFIRERNMTQEVSILERTMRITGQAKEIRQYGGKKKKLQNVVEPSSDEVKFKKLLEIQGFNPLNISADVLKK